MPTDRDRARTFRVWREPAGAWTEDPVAVEEPLEIRVEDEPVAVLMRTPGDDRALVAGFLFGEGIIEEREDLRALAPCADPNRPDASNVYLVQLAAGCPLPTDTHRRTFVTSASCGLCGKTTIESIHRRAAPLGEPRPLEPSFLEGVGAHLRGHQRLFTTTGGSHCAAVFGARAGGERPLLGAAEDVGRHNAADKVIGAQLLAGVAADPDAVLWLSGRASFEMVQKALVARIGAVVCVGAPTSLAVELARESGVTLVGFAAGGGRHNIYNGRVA